MMPDYLDALMEKRKREGLLRTLSLSEGLIDLTSNDYFGFARLLDPLEKANRSGATGSRLLTGNTPFYAALEEKIAHFHRAPSALVYTSGYTANLGLISALGTEEVTFLYDLEVHASMIDGMRLSKAKYVPFRHNDLNSLERQLQRASNPSFVLVESLYSMNGDLAPLQEIVTLCTRYNAQVIVDEAHATGICGPEGRGYVCQLELESHIFARIHTFSKALGSHGACVLGSQKLKEYLVNFSRPLIYTTALPLSTLTSIQASYDKLQKESGIHQQRLSTLIAYFQKKFNRPNFPTLIQPLSFPGAQQVRHLSHKLKECGLDVRAILPPTIKKGKECLRVVLHSFNREEDIDQLAEVLG